MGNYRRIILAELEGIARMNIQEFKKRVICAEPGDEYYGFWADYCRRSTNIEEVLYFLPNSSREDIKMCDSVNAWCQFVAKTFNSEWHVYELTTYEHELENIIEEFDENSDIELSDFMNIIDLSNARYY